MAKFLPVAPANYLESIYEKCSMEARHAFLLAHEVVTDELGYGRLKNVYWDRLNHLLLLDNSAIELGAAVDSKLVKAAQKITGANVVVLPDVLEKSQETLESSWDVYANWIQIFKNRKPQSWDNDYVAELLFIPQGETFQSWVWCFESFLDRCDERGLPYPSWVGIPRNTTGRIILTRKYLIDVVKARCMSKIHLMGFSDNMVDDMVSARYDARVQSIDSNVPFRMAEFQMSAKVPSRGNWWVDNKMTPIDDVPKFAVRNWMKVNGMVQQNSK